jgi:hypothetical protein
MFSNQKLCFLNKKLIMISKKKLKKLKKLKKYFNTLHLIEGKKIN